MFHHVINTLFQQLKLRSSLLLLLLPFSAPLFGMEKKQEAEIKMERDGKEYASTLRELAQVIIDERFHLKNMVAREGLDESSRTAIICQWRQMKALLKEHGITEPLECHTGETLLMIAAQAKKPALVKLLIDHGADVNAIRIDPIDGSRFTPLSFATLPCFANQDYESESLIVAQYLLTAGANPNPKASNPLINAVENKNIGLAQALITARAHINIQAGARRRTPLITAVYNRDAQMIALLVAAGADLTIPDVIGQTVYKYARYNNKTGRHALMASFARQLYPQVIATIMGQYIDHNTQSLDSFITDHDRLSHWLNDGSAVNAYDKDGSTNLMIAIRGKNDDIAHLLIEAHADVDAQHKKTGDTALHIAARAGNEEIVDALLCAHAKIDACNKAIETPLMAIAKIAPWQEWLGAVQNHPSLKRMTVEALWHLEKEAKARFAVAKRLIRAGANPNIQSWDTYSPLMHAVDYENLPLVHCLLENGARTDFEVYDEVTGRKRKAIDFINPDAEHARTMRTALLAHTPARAQDTEHEEVGEQKEKETKEVS